MLSSPATRAIFAQTHHGDAAAEARTIDAKATHAGAPMLVFLPSAWDSSSSSGGGLGPVTSGRWMAVMVTVRELPARASA